MGEDIPGTRRKRSKKILKQNKGTKNHNKKAKWINNMDTKLRILEEGPKVKNTSKHARQHLKILKWKTLDLDGMHRFWFLKFTSIHNRLATEMNKYI